MEREYLINGIIVVVVLFVLFVGFFSLYPETKQKIEKFTSGFLGSSFVKSDEEIRQTVKLMADSLDSCSALLGNGCVCDVEMDVIPGDNTLVVDNQGEESKFILVDESQKVDATWNLGGRKVGVPVLVSDGSAWNLYCSFEKFVMVYDSGWNYEVISGNDIVSFSKMFSSDKVSLYPVMKLSDGNFCLVGEDLIGFDKAVSKDAVSSAGLVKIGTLPVVKGVFSDSYSGKEFFNRLKKCTAYGSR